MKLLAALPLLAAATALAATFDVPVPKMGDPAPSATQGASSAPQGPAPRIEITVPGARTPEEAKAALARGKALAICRVKPIAPDDPYPCDAESASAGSSRP